MNALGIDYGTKNIGLAYSINQIIFTLKPIKNDNQLLNNLKSIISTYSIDHVYVGLSEGKIADLTLKFVDVLRSMVEFPVETVDEAVSTIEAENILKTSKTARHKYSQSIDSASAAVILNRVIN